MLFLISNWQFSWGICSALTLAWIHCLNFYLNKDRNLSRSEQIGLVFLAGLMAALFHTESRRLYSWWWDSHNSPKNSKWLQENLTGIAFTFPSSFLQLGCKCSMNCNVYLIFLGIYVFCLEFKLASFLIYQIEE